MIPYRIARELTYQLDAARQQEWLTRALSTIPMFVVLYQGETREEVLIHWKKLTDAGYDLVAAYRQSLELYRSEGHPDEAIVDALKKLAGLLDAQGYWSAAEEMMHGLLDVALQLGDRESEGAAHRALGWLAIHEGEYAEAVKELEHSLAIAQSLHDRLAEANAIGYMGVMYRYRAEYDRALECYERQRTISEELGDRRGLSMAMGNMGIVYFRRGEYDRALECYERQRTISEELGDRRVLSIAIGNMGLVYSYRAEYDRALESFETQRAVSEELGDRYGLGLAIGNLGGVYSDRGAFDRALECYQAALDGHRAIGYLNGVIDWLGGITTVLLDLTHSSEEPSNYLRNYLHRGGQDAASSDGWREVAMTMARQYADECLQLSEQLSKPDTHFAARLLLVQIDAAEGKSAAVFDQLTRLLADAADDSQRAELHYLLWTLARDKGRGQREESEKSKSASLSDTSFIPHPSALDSHRSEALRLYEELLAKTPTHEYSRRFEELTAGGVDAC